jgi:large conductance mechanosensitive channel
VSIFREFREFIARGNVIDLAVGVIIGGAFGKIVSSLVSDIVMPPIGLALGGVDFAAFKWVIKPGDPAHKVAEVAISYGVFFNTLVQFLIIAVVIFLMIKAINTMQRATTAEAAEPPAPGPTPTEALLTQIRDLLAGRGGG